MDFFTLLAIVSMMIFLGSTAMVVFLYRQPVHDRITRLFYFAFGLLAIWGIGDWIVYAYPDLSHYWLGDKLASIGWILFSAVFLHMNLILTEHTHLINQKWKQLLLYSPAVFLLLWEFFLLGPGVGRAKVDVFYLAHGVYYLFYGCLVLGALVVWGLRSDSKRKRIQAWIVFNVNLAAMLSAVCLELFFPVVIAEEGRAEPMHIFAFILFAGYWHAVQRYGFFSVVSLIHPEDLLERISDIVIVVDKRGIIAETNPRFQQIVGCPKGDEKGHCLDRFVEGQILAFAEAGNGSAKLTETFLRTNSGERIPIQVRVSCIWDKAKDVAGFVLVGQDMRLVAQLKEEIEQRKRKEAELEYSSFHDVLTGLYNRAFFEKKLRELERTAAYPVGIVLADIDGLKLVNDTYGHDAGDQLLLEAAAILQGITEEKGLIARVDGDEFAVIVTEAGTTAIKAMEEQVRIRLEAYNRQSMHLSLSISVGSAVSEFPGQNLNELYKLASDTMYQLKLSQGQSIRNGMVQALLHTLGAKHIETEDHAERLRDLAVQLGEAMGLAQREVAQLSLLAQFHDLGKVGIPDRILLKPGPLDREEWAEMKRHPEIGYQIAQSVQELMPVANLILLHHENWDGSGYPMGLAGEQIPLACRIIAIVDTYDAMTNDRPYRSALSQEQALAELCRCAGQQFDPVIVPKFVEMCKALMAEAEWQH